MRFPLHITTDNIRHQWRNARAGRERYPFVLMLEPLYACNLACIGCTPERHTGKLKDRLTLEQCLQAVDDAGAPIVSICGGEPLMYPELPELIQGIIDRGKGYMSCLGGKNISRIHHRGDTQARAGSHHRFDAHSFRARTPQPLQFRLPKAVYAENLGAEVIDN